MNTETITLNSLALGWGRDMTFEMTPSSSGSSGLSLFKTTGFIRSTFSISAVVGLTPVNQYLALGGPSISLPPSTRYRADFILRSPSTTVKYPTWLQNPSLRVAKIQAYDTKNCRSLATTQLTQGQFNGGLWGAFGLQFSTTSATLNSIEFRVWWDGNQNMDTGAVRLLKL